MKDWGQDDEPPSLALRIEIIALLIAWAMTAFLVIITIQAGL